jgi:selenophosphate synthetase-related protein
MGFVLTAKEEHSDEVCRRFRKVGIEARTIGRVNTSRELKIQHSGKERSVFDLEKDGITGLYTIPS